jgi:hypothetical protein
MEHKDLEMELMPIGWHWPFVVTPVEMAVLTAIAGSRVIGFNEHSLPTLSAVGAAMVTVGTLLTPVTYPDPPWTMLTAVTAPVAEIVAVAVATRAGCKVLWSTETVTVLLGVQVQAEVKAPALAAPVLVLTVRMAAVLRSAVVH